MSRARLITTWIPRRPRAIVIVLHGGAGRRPDLLVRPTQLSVLRMIPVAFRIAVQGRGQVAVFRLLNSSRGWNVERTPVQDARWAIGQVRRQLGPSLPIGLVGHSLGGRAALLAAADTSIAAAVALNPYLQLQDGATDVTGTDVLVVHGTADRVASPRVVELVVEMLRKQAPVTLTWVEGGKHAMLAHHRRFDRAAADFVVRRLTSAHPRAEGAMS